MVPISLNPVREVCRVVILVFAFRLFIVATINMLDTVVMLLSPAGGITVRGLWALLSWLMIMYIYGWFVRDTYLYIRTQLECVGIIR